jgi:hypothetical protein
MEIFLCVVIVYKNHSFFLITFIHSGVARGWLTGYKPPFLEMSLLFSKIYNNF